MIVPIFVSSAGYLVAGRSLLIAVDGYLRVAGVIPGPQISFKRKRDKDTDGGRYNGDEYTDEEYTRRYERRAKERMARLREEKEEEDVVLSILQYWYQLN